jgi:hypothetical protein
VPFEGSSLRESSTPLRRRTTKLNTRRMPCVTLRGLLTSSRNYGCAYTPKLFPVSTHETN